VETRLEGTWQLPTDDERGRQQALFRIASNLEDAAMNQITLSAEERAGIEEFRKIVRAAQAQAPEKSENPALLVTSGTAITFKHGRMVIERAGGRNVSGYRVERSAPEQIVLQTRDTQGERDQITITFKSENEISLERKSRGQTQRYVRRL
jgi:hypothetical protein